MEGYINKSRWVDLSSLPKFKFGNNERIKWDKSVGCIIPFKCGSVHSFIRIIEHKYMLLTKGKRMSQLLITIDDYIYSPIWISAKSILRCAISSYLKSNKASDCISNKNWTDLSVLPKINKGAHFGDIDWKNSAGCMIDFNYENISGKILIGKYKRPKIEIFIDKYMEKPQFIPTQSVIDCSLFYILGNRIADVRPDLILYLKNKDDAYYYNILSNQYINVICPICGYEKTISVFQLSQYGIACPLCSDGVSFPNKFLTSVFQQVGVRFKRELSKKDIECEWIGKYRYDFYFTINNKHYIVEADGGQHKNENQKKIDIIKTRLAEQHGYMIIRIDCDYGSDDYNRADIIKNNILQSLLPSIINLENIDWKRCSLDATKSLIKETCLLWEDSKMNMEQISQSLYISKSSVRRYLKIGSEIGICKSYNSYNTRYRGKSQYWKQVGIFKCGVLVDVCESIQNTYQKYQGKYGMPNTYNGFRSICLRNSQKQYDGYTISFISDEEYSQYKMIGNNQIL